MEGLGSYHSVAELPESEEPRIREYRDNHFIYAPMSTYATPTHTHTQTPPVVTREDEECRVVRNLLQLFFGIKLNGTKVLPDPLPNMLGYNGNRRVTVEVRTTTPV